MRHVVVLLVLGGLVQAVQSFRPQTGEASDFAGLALGFGFLMLAAFHGGRVVSKIRLPKIIAYILVGVVAGPEVLDLVPEATVHDLRLVNGVAVCLIALTAGGELAFQRFKPLFGVIAKLSFWAVLGTCVTLSVLLFGMQPLLPFFHGNDTRAVLAIAAMLGITLSAQSPAVVMALLSETHADGPVTRTMLGTVVIADLVVIVLFGIASALVQATVGSAVDPADTAAAIGWELGGSIVAGALVGGVLALYLRLVGRGAALFVLLQCVVVAEVGRRVHLDPLIVMLVAGMFIENATRAGAEHLLNAIESASLPVFLVFFALAGASIHLHLLVVLFIPAAIIVATRAASFWAGSKIATAGAPPAVKRWSFVGLLPQAGLALALALLVKRVLGGEAGDEASALVLAVIAMNELIMPVFVRHALVASGEAGARIEHELGEDEHHLPPAPAVPAEAVVPALALAMAERAAADEAGADVSVDIALEDDEAPS